MLLGPVSCLLEIHCTTFFPSIMADFQEGGDSPPLALFTSCSKFLEKLFLFKEVASPNFNHTNIQ